MRFLAPSRIAAFLLLLPVQTSLAADASATAPKAAPAATTPASSAKAPAAAPAATPASDYRDLAAKITAKQRTLRDAGTPATEEAFKDEFAQFDVLLQRYKDVKTQDVARILYSKGLIYVQVVNQPEKAKGIYEQVQRDYPGTSSATQARLALDNLPRLIEAQKAQQAQQTARSAADEQALAALPAAVRPIAVKVNAKFQAGRRAEADLSPEIAEVDALLAAKPGDKSEETAQIQLFKSSILAIFSQEKSLELARFIKGNYPGTKASDSAGEQIARVEAAIAAEKIRKTLVVGSLFPDFQVTDTKGQPLSVSQFRGKVVLVDFWAMWCGPCLEELPNVIAAYDKFHGQGFEIVGISLDREGDAPRLASFTVQNKMPWPQYFDGKYWQNVLAVKYGVNSIPASYLLDREGRIVAVGPRGSELEREVEKVLGKK